MASGCAWVSFKMPFRRLFRYQWRSAEMAGLCEYFKQPLPSDWIHSWVSAALVVCSGLSQVINVSFNASKQVSCISWDNDCIPLQFIHWTFQIIALKICQFFWHDLPRIEPRSMDAAFAECVRLGLTEACPFQWRGRVPYSVLVRAGPQTCERRQIQVLFHSMWS